MTTSFAASSLTQAILQSGAEAGRQRTGHLWSSLAQVCALLDITPGAAARDNETVFQHMQLKTGQRLYTIGQQFDMLYIVNSGFMKSVMIDESGNEQVLNFPMKGDLLGTDGIHMRQYASEVVALSSCDVIMIPFKTLNSLNRLFPEMEMALFNVMSRELSREQSMVTMIGSLSAEARVARFIANLSERFALMGYSSKEFNLRMTRQEIGSYLGLTLETVSRTFSAFAKIGYIGIEGRAVVIKDIVALKTLRRLPPSRTANKLFATSAIPAITSPETSEASRI